MTTFQKLALSMLISVLVFSAFAVIAYGGLFDYIEAVFYDQKISKQYEELLKRIANESASYLAAFDSRLKALSEDKYSRTVFLLNQSQDNITGRSSTIGSLLEESQEIASLRFVDNEYRAIHFSTVQIDIRRRLDFRIEYNRFDLEENKVLRDALIAMGIDKTSVFIPERQTILFRHPVRDQLDVQRGWLAAEISLRGLQKLLLSKRIISQNETIGVLNTSSIVVDVPDSWLEPGALVELQNLFQQRISGEAGVYVSGGKRFLPIFATAEQSQLSTVILIDDTELQIDSGLKIILLGSVFITTFLLLFLLINIKQDPVIVLSERIRKLQAQILSGMAGSLAGGDLKKLQLELEQRREEVKQQIKKGLGKQKKKRSEEIDGLIDKGWDDVLAVLGRKQGGDSAVDLDRLERIIEKAVKNLKVEAVVSADSLTKKAVRSETPQKKLGDVITTSDKKAKQETKQEEPSARVLSGKRVAIKVPVEEPDEAEAVEELEEAEVVDELDEAEAVEELEDAEAVEELDEAEAVEELEEAEVVDELDEAEAVEELEDAEAVEEPDEAEAVEELEEAEVVDELDEAEAVEELEDAEAVEELDEAEAVEELEEAEVVDELDEAEAVEELEDAEAVEEPYEAEAVEELEEAEVVDELDEAEAVEELEDAEAVEELEEAEAVEELEEVEAVGELDEAEAVKELDDPEVVDELEDAEAVEELDEGEAVEELEEAEVVDELDEAEAVEELEEAEAVEELEEVEAVGELDEAEAVDELEEAEAVEDLEAAARSVELEEVAAELLEADEAGYNTRFVPRVGDDEKLEVLDEFEAVGDASLERKKSGQFFVQSDKTETSENAAVDATPLSPVTSSRNVQPLFGYDLFSLHTNPERGKKTGKTSQSAPKAAAKQEISSKAKMNFVQLQNAGKVELYSFTPFQQKTTTDSLFEEIDGVVKIKEKAFHLTSEKPTDSGFAALVDQVLRSHEHESGLERIVGSHDIDFEDIVGPVAPVRGEKTKSEETSRIILKDGRLDYDQFLKGFPDTEPGFLKALMVFGRKFESFVTGLLLPGEKGFILEGGLGFSDEGRGRVLVSAETALGKYLAVNSNAAFINHPVTLIQDFGILSAKSMSKEPSSVLLIPISYKQKSGWIMIGLHKTLGNLSERVFGLVA